MRAAAHAKVDQYDHVQGVCGTPRFNAPGRAAEGQAFFLRMEAAWRDWCAAGQSLLVPPAGVANSGQNYATSCHLWPTVYGLCREITHGFEVNPS
jgi:hypothetical protein